MKDRLLKYAFIASLSLNAFFGIEHALAFTAVKTGAVEGYVKSSITVGNPQQAMIAQLPADQVLPAAFTMPESKPSKVAEEPRPGRNPFYKAQ